MKQETLKRLELQEERHAPAPGHVAIYDASSGELLNGAIPAAATTIIFLPDNGRDKADERTESKN